MVYIFIIYCCIDKERFVNDLEEFFAENPFFPSNLKQFLHISDKFELWSSMSYRK